MSLDEVKKSKLLEQLRETKLSTPHLRRASTEVKNRVLTRLADQLLEKSAEILLANTMDLFDIPGDATPAFRDRLTLSDERLTQMAESLRKVAELPDPVGEIVEEKVIQQNLKTRKIRGPLGVIFMIFESRPNVAIEAFSLAFKSGNAVILRSGKESQRTVGIFYALIRECLKEEFLPEDLWDPLESTCRHASLSIL